jgi:predicted nucleic acid-binding protein
VKTYVLDASALFAFLQHTAGGPKVSELFKESAKLRVRILMSAVNYGEVYGRVLRDAGMAVAARARSVVATLPVELVEATPERAIRAAEAKVTYRLDYADSFAAALALEHKATLVTSDSDFRKLGHGVGVVWLKS